MNGDREQNSYALVYGENLAYIQFMAVRRVPACSSDCQVSSDSGEASRQECALTDGLRERRDIPPDLQIPSGFSLFKLPFFSGRAWLSSNINARFTSGQKGPRRLILIFGA